MKFVLLTHDEAADEAVMRHVAQFLMAPAVDGPVMIGAGPPAAITGPVFRSDPEVGTFGVDSAILQASPGDTTNAVLQTPAAVPTVGLADNPATGSDASALSTAAAAAFGIAPTSSAALPTLPNVPIPPAPPTAPEAAAPSAPAAPSNPAAAGTSTLPTPGAPLPQVDSDGLPWDARIHASTKGTTADGKWRRKAKVDDAVFSAVVAELKAALSAPALPPVPPAAAAAVAPTLPPVQLPSIPAATMTPEQAFSQPGVVPPVPPAAGDALTSFDGLTFQVLMEHISKAMERQALQPQDMMDVCTELSLPNPMMLGARPDLVPHFGQKLAARLSAKGSYL